MATKVGPEGQVVIEQAIRDQLGVEPGWTALQLLVDGHVELYFIPPEHNDSLLGVLAQYTDVRIPDEDALHDAIEWARGEEAAEAIERWRENSSER